MKQVLLLFGCTMLFCSSCSNEQSDDYLLGGRK